MDAFQTSGLSPGAPLLTAKDAAALLRISPRQAYRVIHNPIRIGTSVRFLPEEVERVRREGVPSK